MTKIVWGFIKFYFVYMAFGVLAIIILYASADVKCFIQTGESFFRTMFYAPDSIDNKAGEEAVLNFLKIAFDSVPGDTYYDAVLGISLDSNVGVDMISLIFDLMKGGEAVPTLIESFLEYDLFLRDMSVATCASMVIYAVMHFKTKVAGMGFSVVLGFALASIFWILAGYTFGETVTYALEMRVNTENLNILYFIIIITAIVLESSIHAYGGKCSALRLVVLLCLKVVFNLLKSVFAWYMCRSLAPFLHIGSIESSMGMIGGATGMLTSAGIIICISLIESKLTKWAEKARA